MENSGLELIAEGIRLLAAEDAHSLPDQVLLRSIDALLTVVAGEISLEHAARIVSLLTTSEEDLREVIEKELVEAARYRHPTKLGQFCRALNEQLGNAPNAAERDARQYAGRWLRLTRTMDGMRRLDGMLDPTGAATVEAALHGLSTSTDGPEDFRTVGQRRADALVAMAQFTLTHGDTTDNGGDPANIMVLAPLDTLRHELDTAGITSNGILDGEPLSAATVRRLACDAGIIPTILGSPSEVLDLGRRTPTWNVAQRRALKIESGGHCRWHRCHTHVQSAHAHHITWRSHGGPTDTRKAVHS